MKSSRHTAAALLAAQRGQQGSELRAERHSVQSGMKNACRTSMALSRAAAAACTRSNSPRSTVHNKRARSIGWSRIARIRWNSKTFLRSTTSTCEPPIRSCSPRCNTGRFRPRIVVAIDGQADGVQADRRSLENLASVERYKSVAEDRRRGQIRRPHRGHSDAAKPRRLIGSVTEIRA